MHQTRQKGSELLSFFCPLSILLPSSRAQMQVKAIDHSLICVTRPRSFTSPILLGIGTLLYRKYGSRHLVDILSAMGFSSSYGEVRKLEMSSLQQPLDIITKNSFTH
uniref:Uncharacterized protein n=1 Tax=Lygus hesperus TaxID=30085 RepID=A0A0K8SXV5_LYGHE